MAYARLLAADPGTEPGALLADCGRLTDPDLRGDCGLAVARRAAAAGTAAPEALCDQLSGEVWQAECYFMAAEDHNEAGDAAAAARLCLAAARFSDHCSQHLWQRALRALTWSQGSAAFSRTLPRAHALYSEWSPLLAAETDFEVRFWRRYFEGGFERDRLLDVAACAPLRDDEDRLRCQAAASSLYARRIQEVAHLPRAAAALCTAPEATTAALAASGVPQFRIAPSPLLDPVVVRSRERDCTTEGAPLPPGEPPVLAPASP